MIAGPARESELFFRVVVLEQTMFGVVVGAPVPPGLVLHVIASGVTAHLWRTSACQYEHPHKIHNSYFSHLPLP
jgi:hypothetical protein